MNPYEAPQAGDEPIPVPRSTKLIVAVTRAVLAGMIIGGVATFYIVRSESARMQKATAIRAQKAVEANVRKAEEAASKAEMKRDSPAQ